MTVHPMCLQLALYGGAKDMGKAYLLHWHQSKMLAKQTSNDYDALSLLSKALSVGHSKSSMGECIPMSWSMILKCLLASFSRKHCLLATYNFQRVTSRTAYASMLWFLHKHSIGFVL